MWPTNFSCPVHPGVQGDFDTPRKSSASAFLIQNKQRTFLGRPCVAGGRKGRHVIEAKKTEPRVWRGDGASLATVGTGMPVFLTTLDGGECSEIGCAACSISMQYIPLLTPQECQGLRRPSFSLFRTGGPPIS